MTDKMEAILDTQQKNGLDEQGRLRHWLLAGPFDRNAVQPASQTIPQGILDMLRKMSDAELIEIRDVARERGLNRAMVRRSDPDLASRLERLDVGLAEAKAPASASGIDEKRLQPRDGDALPSTATTSGKVEWFPFTADPEGHLNLISAFWQYDATPRDNLGGKPDHSLGYAASQAGYAATYIDSPRARTVRMRLNWSGEGGIVLNGESLEPPIEQGYCAQAHWDLPLRKGENILLIRLAGPFEGGPWDERWGWGFSAEFPDAEDCVFRAPMDDSRPILSAELCPTPFYPRAARKESQKRLFHLVLLYCAAPAEGRAVVRYGGKEHPIDLGWIEPGLRRIEVCLPDHSESALAEVMVEVGEATVSVSAQIDPGVHYTIFIVESSHLDIAFTDPQDHVSDTQVEICDACLRFIDEEGDPDFRFTVEGTWTLNEFAAARTPDRVERLMELARQGRIEFGALNSSLSAWGTGDEELCREFMRAAEIRKRHNVPIQSALFVDVPGIGWGLAEALYQAGVRFLMSGMNECFNARSLARALPRDFWWETPSGGRLLVCAHRGYYAPAELHPNMLVEGKMHVLSRHILEKEADREPGDHVIFFGSNYDNTLPTLHFSRAARDWNTRFAYPRMVIATASQAMAHVEQAAGEDLPVLRGDWAGYWDGRHHGAPTDCRIRERLVRAEKLLSTLALEHPDVSGLHEVIRQAYEMLIDARAHGANGTAFGTDLELRQAQRWHRARMALVESLAEGLITRAERLAAHRWSTGSPTGHLFYNPLSWRRDALVEFESRNLLMGDASEKAPEALAMRDVETGMLYPLLMEPIPSHTFMRGNRQGTRARFVARDIPSMGYRRFEVVPDKNSRRSPALEAGADWIQNAFYRIEVEPESGRILRLIDRRLGRDIVDPDATTGFALSHVVDRPRHWLHAAQPETKDDQMVVRIVDESPVQVRIVVEQKGSLDVVSEIALHADIDAVFLSDTFSDASDASSRPHRYRGVLKDFPLRMDKPRATIKASNTTFVPGVDQLPGAGHHGNYVPQYGGEIGNEEWGIAWAAFGVSCVRFEGIDVDRLRKPPLPDNPTLRFVSTPHGGHGEDEAVSVRYALRIHPGKADPAEVVRFGMELAQPMMHAGGFAGEEREAVASREFFSVDNPDVAIQSLKREQGGSDWIIRLHEIAGRDAEVTLRSKFLQGARATMTDLLEAPGEALAVSGDALTVFVPRHAIVSIRITPAGA